MSPIKTSNMPSKEELHQLNIDSVTKELDALTLRLAKQRAELDRILSIEEGALDTLSKLPAQIAYDSIVSTRKVQVSLVAVTKKELQDTYLNLYNLSDDKTDKKPHSCGGIRVSKKHLILNMKLATQWCVDHNMFGFLTIPNPKVKDFCNSVLSNDEDSPIVEIKEVPGAAIKSDLSDWIEEE